jgi:ADP-dependent NAD(P)H-hydrate dehydratase / NAD(P)H-hydrate epimerase
VHEFLIYQTQQIRDFERMAQERYGITGDTLMQRAGQAAFATLKTRWPDAKNIAVFCGSGNNGGDGYVLAHAAHTQGMTVQIWQVGNHEHLKNEAKKAQEQCQAANITMAPFDDNIELNNTDLIVDAICGIGLVSHLRDDVLRALEKIQASCLPVFAIDIPTGVNADTGYVIDKAIQAAATITFIGLKFGLLTGNGVSYSGDIILNDLALPTELYADIKAVAEKIDFQNYAHYFKPRLRDWHKGLSGHVLVVGGASGFSGAPRMSAMAALRVGAGLVTVADHPDSAETMYTNFPEIMCHPIHHAEDLKPLIAKATVIVLGPGLQQTPWSREIWELVCQQQLPLVLDADGLNLLAQHHQQWMNPNCVLTPHPAEAARLLQTTTLSVQQNRLSAIQNIVKKYQSICVLKGAGSLVVAPDALPALCDKGNPGMSTAGTGDILSGVIGGLIAQSIPLFDAAKLGVYIHALAGDLAAQSGERGMIATDLLPYLRQIVNLNE